MNRSVLVRWFGFPATLIHGDTLVWDRWRWLKRRLPPVARPTRLIDIGCGSGAFSIGAARRGYSALGLSWDIRNQQVAAERAALCSAPLASFEVLDVRVLDTRRDLAGQFDVAICLENIEHILDDRKLMRDIAACLKAGGRLLLTTPNIDYRPISEEDNGPFIPIEDGRHVRRGYSEAMLADLCANAGLALDSVSYCSGFASQKITGLLRRVTRHSHTLAWALVLPLRVLPPLLDPLIPRALWPGFSICLEAHKP